MRVGLRGQTRRVWAPRGTKVRQPIQLVYDQRYLTLAMEPFRGALRWAWVPGCSRRCSCRPSPPGSWTPSSGIAPSHRGEAAQALRAKRLLLPPHASLGAKLAAAEKELRALAADPDRVRRLCGWARIREALTNLPPDEERRQP